MFTYILLQFLPKYTHPCPALYCTEKKSVVMKEKKTMRSLKND